MDKAVLLVRACKALDLVKQIASDSPITPLDEINVCKFCDSSWAESSYDDYLAHQKAIDGYTVTDKPQWGTPAASALFNLRNAHHHDDCLWVRANEVLASRG